MVIKFNIPSRGIIGLRNQLLTATAGEAIMSHRFIGYEPFKGAIPGRNNGSLISMEMEKQFLILSINYKIVVNSSLILTMKFMKVK
jgi:predicted membrane GTPase involved in stress response